MIKLKFTRDRGSRRTGEIVSYDENSAQVILDEGAAELYSEPSTDDPSPDSEATDPDPVGRAPEPDPVAPVEVVTPDLVVDPTSITEEQATEPAPKSTRRKPGES